MSRARRALLQAAVAVPLAVCSVLGPACRPGPPEAIPEPPLGPEVEAPVAAAVAEARARVEALPGSADAWMHLGDVLHAHGWDGEAVRCYEAAARLDPDRFDAWYQAALLRAATDPEEAARAFRRALEADPSYVPAWLRLGEVRIVLGHLDEAEDAFREALRRDPKSAAARFGLARVALRRGEAEAARELLDAVFEAGAATAEVHRLAAQVHQRLGRAGDAAYHARKAEASAGGRLFRDPREVRPVKPSGSMAWNQRGIEAGRRGDVAEAERCFRRALEIRPDYAEAYFNLGTLLARNGRLDEAVAALQEAVRLAPYHVESRLNLALALKDAGRAEEAEQGLREVLARRPGHPAARLALADLQAARGEVRAASRELLAVLDAHPAHPGAARRLALLASEHPGLGAEALRRAEEETREASFQAGHQDPGLLEALASVLAARGETDEAQALFRRAFSVALGQGRRDVAARIQARARRFEL